MDGRRNLEFGRFVADSRVLIKHTKNLPWKVAEVDLISYMRTIGHKRSKFAAPSNVSDLRLSGIECPRQGGHTYPSQRVSRRSQVY